MGTLRSAFDMSGTVVNGVTLGQPIEDDDPTTFTWDDSRFPNGELDADGNLTVDEVAL